MKEVALITGASSGIGKELAYIHAAQKKDLVLIARSAERLGLIKNDLESKYPVQVVVIVKDLSQREAPMEIYEELKSKNIEIEYLINNAGFGGLGYFAERDWQKDEEMIHVNIRALTALTRLFLPDMIKRKSGKILNVSSTASLMPGPLQAVYYASKAYVTSFSNALSVELKGTGVSCTALLPGATATEFGDVSGMNKTVMFKNPYPASLVAADGYNAMMKGQLNKITAMSFGQKISMMLLPFLPKKMVMNMIFKLQKV